MIDFHVHPPVEEYLRGIEKFKSSLEAFFKVRLEPKSMDEVLSEYDELGVKKLVLLAFSAEVVAGVRADNELVARLVDEHPDRLVGFASLNPWRGRAALEELERAVKDLGLRGLKLYPNMDAFYPDDVRFYPLYQRALELGVPVMFHTGTTGLGAGLPGGAGVRLEYSRPIHIDRLASDFPDLTIIMAHPAWPWLEEQLAVVAHKANVYMDLSGWAPRYFPEMLLTYLKVFIPDKCLFGTDYPFIRPGRWLSEFRQLGLPEEVVRKVLEENARRVLGLPSTR